MVCPSKAFQKLAPPLSILFLPLMYTNSAFQRHQLIYSHLNRPYCSTFMLLHLLFLLLLFPYFPLLINSYSF